MARTRKNETVTIPATVLKPIADAVRAAGAATRANRRRALEVGREIVKAERNGYDRGDLVKALRAEGFDRSPGWYSQVATAYRAIERAKLGITQAGHKRGTDDRPGGIGAVYTFYNKVKDVPAKEVPDFVAAWIRGHDATPDKPERPDDMVNISVHRATRDAIRVQAEAAGMTVADWLAATVGVSVGSQDKVSA